MTISQETLAEIGKFLAFLVVSAAALAILIVVSPQILPAGDLNGFKRAILMSAGKMILGSVGLIGTGCALNWITPYDWWELLKGGNSAVGIATAGAFIGVGLFLWGAV